MNLPYRYGVSILIKALLTLVCAPFAVTIVVFPEAHSDLGINDSLHTIATDPVSRKVVTSLRFIFPTTIGNVPLLRITFVAVNLFIPLVLLRSP